MRIDFDRDTYFTIRIYPSNTYLCVHNDYLGRFKVLVKAPHRIAQESMAEWLKRAFERYYIRLRKGEFEEILDKYWGLVHEPL